MRPAPPNFLNSIPVMRPARSVGDRVAPAVIESRPLFGGNVYQLLLSPTAPLVLPATGDKFLLLAAPLPVAIKTDTSNLITYWAGQGVITDNFSTLTVLTPSNIVAIGTPSYSALVFVGHDLPIVGQYDGYWLRYPLATYDSDAGASTTVNIPDRSGDRALIRVHSCLCPVILTRRAGLFIRSTGGSAIILTDATNGTLARVAAGSTEQLSIGGDLSAIAGGGGNVTGVISETYEVVPEQG